MDIHFPALTISFEQLIILIQTLIWPLTLVVIILLFKRQFTKAMDRMGSFKADATGISMTFGEEIAQAKSTLGIVGVKGQAKSGTQIRTVFSGGSPYSQLMHIKLKVEEQVEQAVKTANIQAEGMQLEGVLEKLKEVGALRNDSALLIKTILDLANHAPPVVTQLQVNEIRELYNAL